jgi:L-arabinokinase
VSRICFYVTAHGFGHASRCQAVMERLPEARIEVRTKVPRWFFELDPSGRVGAHSHGSCGSQEPLRLRRPSLRGRVELEEPPECLDPGVVQSDSFHHDIPATLAAWQRLLADGPVHIEREAEHLRRKGHDLVVSDAAPLPLAAARRAGLPAVAMCNFTWDWVLQGYVDEEPAFGPVIEEIRRLYRNADLWLRLPLSHASDLFERQLEIGFTTRRPVLEPAAVRSALGLERGQLMVLLSFGGFGVDKLSLRRVPAHGHVRCVWDQGPGEPPHLISARRDLRYIDLIRTADVILTKPGFSIISEAVAQGTLLAYVPRHGFRESALLERFLEREWPSLALSPSALADGAWIDSVVSWVREEPALPAAVLSPHPPRRTAIPVDGAQTAAKAILDLLP